MSEPARLGPYVLGAAEKRRGLFVTYEAIHETLGRRVWLVTTAPTLAAGPDLALALETQATRIARLEGDPTLALLELLRDGDRSAIVLEAPSGPSLRDLMAAMPGAGGFDPEEVVAIGVLLAGALARLHAQGLAHLAVCPEHVHVTSAGALKLGGLLDAAPIGEPASEKGVPEPGPEADYRAPERVSGEPPLAQSDVFSVGVIVHEIASSAHPFHEADRRDAAEASSVARRIRVAAPPPLPETAVDGLDHVVSRALEKLPALRHENAARLAEDLADLLGRSAGAEHVVRGALSRAGFDASPGAERGAPPPSTRPLLLSLGGISAAMVAVMAILGGAGPAPPVGLPAPGRVGYVRVLAHPWAEVSVDGEVVDVTPIGRPISVAPGRHEILLQHPRAPAERRTVDVSLGETVVVDVEMAVERKADVAIDTSP